MTSKKLKTIKIIVPIYEYGLILNEPLILENNIKIRSIDYIKEPKLIEKNLKLLPIKYSYVADIEYTFDPQDINAPYPDIRESILTKIETALRVFNEGAIGFAGIISQPKILPFPMVISYSMPTGEDKYKIDKDKLNKFPEFYQKLDIAYQKKQIAFSWFSKSYFEVPVNKVIDYCICLENLFVPFNSHEKKKFIIQGLTLLKIGQLDKIGMLYDYRNAIVHANQNEQLKIIKKIGSLSKFLSECEEILRDILQIYVEKRW